MLRVQPQQLNYYSLVLLTKTTMSENLEDLKVKIDKAKKELSDLDNLRLERDYITIQIKDGEKRIEAITLQIPQEEAKLLQVRENREAEEKVKDETLLTRESELNKRSVDLDMKDNDLTSREGILATRILELNTDEAKLADIENNISAREAGLRKREDVCAARENAVASVEKYQTLEAKSLMTAKENLDLYIAELRTRENVIKNSEVRIADANAALDAREVIVKSGENRAENRLADLKAYELTIESKHNELRNIDSDLTARELALESDMRGLGKRALNLDIRDETVRMRELELKARERVVDRKEKEFNLDKIQ